MPCDDRSLVRKVVKRIDVAAILLVDTATLSASMRTQLGGQSVWLMQGSR